MLDVSPEPVYKILPAVEWAAALTVGHYHGSADDQRDGFIHLSTARQLAGTAEKYFRDQPGLVLVALETRRLGPDLRWEPSRGGDLFPHLYAPLDVSVASSVESLPLDAAGVPTLPGSVRP